MRLHVLLLAFFFIFFSLFPCFSLYEGTTGDVNERGCEMRLRGNLCMVDTLAAAARRACQGNIKWSFSRHANNRNT